MNNKITGFLAGMSFCVLVPLGASAEPVSKPQSSANNAPTTSSSTAAKRQESGKVSTTKSETTKNSQTKVKPQSTAKSQSEPKSEKTTKTAKNNDADKTGHAEKVKSEKTKNDKTKPDKAITEKPKTEKPVKTTTTTATKETAAKPETTDKSVQAEVLVILPEKGAFSTAATSVHDGLMVAYDKGNFKPKLRFVDNSQRSITDILAKEVKKETQLIIGPLARPQVEELIKAKPKVKVLALNQAGENVKNIWQMALSPDEDALAISKRMQADGVSELIVIAQAEQAAKMSRFREAMKRIWGAKLIDQSQVPAKLEKQQGLLLLGDYEWLVKLPELPTQKIYSVPLIIKEKAELPLGLQFCDIPALYQPNWPELVQAYQQKPVEIPYQRLLAFGADAWDIASHILTNKASQNFKGRTGDIKLINNVVERVPACMVVQKQGLGFQ